MHRELASGKGLADIALIPRKNVDSPAIILELKGNKDADSTFSQILSKDYPAIVREYTDYLLLVGITYDPNSKQHTCRIEKNFKRLRPHILIHQRIPRESGYQATCIEETNQTKITFYKHGCFYYAHNDNLSDVLLLDKKRGSDNVHYANHIFCNAHHHDLSFQ